MDTFAFSKDKVRDYFFAYLKIDLKNLSSQAYTKKLSLEICYILDPSFKLKKPEDINIYMEDVSTSVDMLCAWSKIVSTDASNDMLIRSLTEFLFSRESVEKLFSSKNGVN